MSKCSFAIIIFLFCSLLQLHAQDLTGLWQGTMHNDTTGRTLRYEIAISENKGKLIGYTHTFFELDDKVYYGVKKVKVRMEDGKTILQTDGRVTDNFPDGTPKGIIQVDVLTLEDNGKEMILSGPYHTVRTKTYSSLTGNIRVSKKNDYKRSALVPHLEELGLAKNLSFIPKEEPAIIAVSKPPELKVKEPVKPAKPVKEPIVAPAPVVKGPAADVLSRKIETVQTVFIRSDSLELVLYDNGEVDGDTVSVLMNGKILMPMQGLSTRAIRKTIYLTKEMPDSIQLIMYAENLGSIPPNTGLLVVHDGSDVYEIRFSGDLNKNAAIVFKRKIP